MKIEILKNCTLGELAIVLAKRDDSKFSVTAAGHHMALCDSEETAQVYYDGLIDGFNLHKDSTNPRLAEIPIATA
jgi:hypothetical protein